MKVWTSTDPARPEKKFKSSKQLLVGYISGIPNNHNSDRPTLAICVFVTRFIFFANKQGDTNVFQLKFERHPLPQVVMFLIERV